MIGAVEAWYLMGKTMQKRPRQTDVAKLAGVSPATVSVILNNRLDGNVRVSAETHKRVLDAVAQLGYVVDPVARSLAGGHSALLGVFAVGRIFAAQAHDSYYPYLVGIEQEAEQLGYDLLFFTNNRGATGRRQIYQGQINRLQLADGCILFGADASNEELAQLVADHYPFILIGRRELANHALSYVAADYTSATANIVHTMLTQGHRQIAYIGSRQDETAHRDHYAGYQMAHRQLGLTQLALPPVTLFPGELTATLIRQLLAQGITAFVLESDRGLIGPYFDTLAQLNKRVPDDLSLAILGDPTADWSEPYPITRFSLPYEEMGRRALRLLVALLRESASQRVYTPLSHQELLPCIPVHGATIGPPSPTN